ncbi:hypothetical protein [Nioella ostreopsis]|uniref:hypothetical protein n=1 Tax=Nioella ostreopsis TaxID=2448479 RepID=UPI000FDC635E|nr:hypothetical protein [Nioella ostreopsis]
MKIVRNIILGLVALVGLTLAIVMFFSAGAREHARGFVEDVSARDFAAARDRLHPQLQQQLSEDALQQMFEGSEPYAEVSFSSISVENSRAELSGTATTISDCRSEVRFVLLSDQITSFDITPLCPAP